MSTTTDTPTDKPVDTPTDTPTEGSGKWLAIGGIGLTVIGILVSLYFFAFHLGAAVLSYQKYQSFLWAILDFFFPYFYYPYYAFVVSKEPTPVEAVAGGMRRPRHRSRSRGFFRRI